MRVPAILTSGAGNPDEGAGNPDEGAGNPDEGAGCCLETLEKVSTHQLIEGVRFPPFGFHIEGIGSNSTCEVGF